MHGARYFVDVLGKILWGRASSAQGGALGRVLQIRT